MERKVGQQSGRDRLGQRKIAAGRAGSQRKNEERTRSQAAAGLREKQWMDEDRKKNTKQKQKNGGCLALKKVDSCASLLLSPSEWAAPSPVGSPTG